MKRFFFSSIALMLGMTACTESGLIDAPEFYGNPIVFDTYIGKTPVTKAENCDITTLKGTEDNGGGARIYAFESEKDAMTPSSYASAYLDGELLFDGTSWGYYEGGSEAVDAYMPAGKDLAVVAYGLNVEGNDYMSSVSSDKTEFTFTVQPDVADQVDIVVTPLTFVAESVTGGDTRVPLRFYHLLSRVGFKVQSTRDNDSNIKISSVRLYGNFLTQGRVDLTDSKATPSSSTTGTTIAFQNHKPQIAPLTGTSQTAYELLPDDEFFEISASQCKEAPQQITPTVGGCYMMIMPGVQNNNETGIEVTYQVDDSVVKTERITLAEMNTGITYFTAGNSYEFILSVNTNAIDFSAEVPKDWNKDTNDDQEEDDLDETPIIPNA